MFLRNWGFALSCAFVGVAAGSRPAYAWYGPFCYSSKARQVSLTIPTITGEVPGDLKVSFDDNDDKARLVSVKASTKVKNAHEIILARDENSRNGIFGLIVTSPRSTYGYKYELEFREDASECTGAIIKVSDKFSGDIGGDASVASKPSAPPKTAQRTVKKHVKAVAVVSAPVEEAVVSDEGAPMVGPSKPEQPVEQPSENAQQADQAQANQRAEQKEPTPKPNAEKSDSEPATVAVRPSPAEQMAPVESAGASERTAPAEASSSSADKSAGEAASPAEKAAPAERVAPTSPSETSSESASPESSAPATASKAE